MAMNREDRAKQFLSFDAMKGLGAAIRRMEEKAERVERAELGEEDAEAISVTLSRLARGDGAEVTFYLCGHYVTHVGVVDRVDQVKKMLRLGEEEIPFEDIRGIKRISEIH